MQPEIIDLLQQKTSPLLSVVMAAKNESRFIASAIKSIVAQTYQNWELVIIDDGSTDSTPEVLESFKTIDRRIRWIRNRQSIGLAASLNKGIQETRGTIILRADADDLNFPLRFEEQLLFLNDHPEIDFVGTGAILIDEDGKEIRAFLLPSSHDGIKEISYKNSCFFHPSVAMRRSSLERIGFYDETFVRAQDKELWLRGIRYGCQYGNIPKPLIYYRIRERSTSFQIMLHTVISMFRIGWRYKPRHWFLEFLIFLFRTLVIKIGLYKPRSLR